MLVRLRYYELLRRCNNRKVCGQNIIRVLSGSDNEKVYDLDKDDNSTNYAMTKEDFFTKLINNNHNDIDFTLFNSIFNIIKEIINGD